MSTFACWRCQDSHALGVALFGELLLTTLRREGWLDEHDGWAKRPDLDPSFWAAPIPPPTRPMMRERDWRYTVHSSRVVGIPCGCVRPPEGDNVRRMPIGRLHPLPTRWLNDGDALALCQWSFDHVEWMLGLERSATTSSFQTFDQSLLPELEAVA